MEREVEHGVSHRKASLEVTYFGHFLHDIKCHGLVFHFFHCMPGQHGTNPMIRARHHLFARKKHLGHHGREMLQCGCHGQVVFRRKHLQTAVHDFCDYMQHFVHRYALFLQALVVVGVYFAVLTFLKRKIFYRLQQLRIGNFVFEIPHARDEIAFAVRKTHLDTINHAGFERVSIHPIAWNVFVGDSKIQIFPDHDVFFERCCCHDCLLLHCVNKDYRITTTHDMI